MATLSELAHAVLAALYREGDCSLPSGAKGTVLSVFPKTRMFTIEFFDPVRSTRQCGSAGACVSQVKTLARSITETHGERTEFIATRCRAYDPESLSAIRSGHDGTKTVMWASTIVSTTRWVRIGTAWRRDELRVSPC